MKTSKRWRSRLAGRKCLAGAAVLWIGCTGTAELAAQPLSPISESLGQAENQMLEMAYVAAQGQYEQNHWQEAFSSFAQLAEKRHDPSARVAFQMWKYGPALYRTDFSVTRDQILRWCLLSTRLTAAQPDAPLVTRQCGSY